MPQQQTAQAEESNVNLKTGLVKDPSKMKKNEVSLCDL